jgi:hypothetical protein
MFHVPEKHRITVGAFGSTKAAGNNGAFAFRIKHESVDPKNLEHSRAVYDLICIASDGMGWEHVSVHKADNKKTFTPSWDDMCHIKDAFWDPEDCVVQYHPPKSQYVNCHENVLHLWRKIGFEFPLPDPLMVGIPKTSKP